MADTETARYARWQAHGRSVKNRRNRLILEELMDWWRGITCPSDTTGAEEDKDTHPNRAGAARVEGGGLGACRGLDKQCVQAQARSSEERGGCVTKAGLVQL